MAGDRDESCDHELATRSAARASVVGEFLHRLADAIVLAAPYAVAANFEDGLRHCLEASACVAQVMRMLGVEARARPAMVWARAEDETFSIAAGHVKLPHEVVIASHSGQTILLDATLGQLRRIRPGVADEIPNAVWTVWSPLTWAAVEIGKCRVTYNRTELPKPVVQRWNRQANSYRHTELKRDIWELVRLARSVDAKSNEFLEALERRRPELLERAERRM